MEIIGYKGFNKDLTNRYGKKFEIGKNITLKEASNGEHLVMDIICVLTLKTA